MERNSFEMKKGLVRLDEAPSEDTISALVLSPSDRRLRAANELHLIYDPACTAEFLGDPENVAHVDRDRPIPFGIVIEVVAEPLVVSVETEAHLFAVSVEDR